MAKKVIIVDDIDGTEGDGIVTQRFSLGSDYYVIDLCPQPVEPAGGAGAVCVGGAAGDQGPAQKEASQ